MPGSMPVVWSPTTRDHDPHHEVWLGVATPAVEVAERVDALLAVLGSRELVCAREHGREALAAVHDPELLDFLATAHDRWSTEGYADSAGQAMVTPYFFPTPALTSGMPVRRPTALHGLTGRFCYDTMTLVGPGTWSPAVAAADCALTAAELVVGGSPAAYALCRPPGHHATPTGHGGSCYLNNAALAAQALRDSGRARVAVVDLDAHHGNGTQAVFWERGDVRYGSLHVDPAAGWFPHVLGHAEETGAGAGAGATRNLPLPPGTGDGPWLEAVADLADWVSGCEALVVSLGVDAAVEDPESPLQVTSDGYAAAGRLLGGLGLPSVVVQEGGYHLPWAGWSRPTWTPTTGAETPGPAIRQAGPMIVAFSISPTPTDGTGSVSEAVTAAVRVVRDSGLPHELNSMFTNVEGEWDEVMAVVKEAVAAVAAVSPRVGLVLKADIRPGYEGQLSAKVERVERALEGS